MPAEIPLRRETWRVRRTKLPVLHTLLTLIFVVYRFMTSKMGGRAAQHLLERAALGVDLEAVEGILRWDQVMSFPSFSTLQRDLDLGEDTCRWCVHRSSCVCACTTGVTFQYRSNDDQKTVDRACVISGVWLDFPLRPPRPPRTPRSISHFLDVLDDSFPDNLPDTFPDNIFSSPNNILCFPDNMQHATIIFSPHVAVARTKSW